ncbi:hypothetical protein D9Q98_001578 [Chlorella vulgaris]|uniref:type I protein arginine methyltransferase n=1 Tax=Chlorella vulgaris TaxID=3077 RepID=A0A9D4Z0E0_CHLVU|nr:hypothetical protein D9Q98_001578 [Chlorella vulgaris]
MSSSDGSAAGGEPGQQEVWEDWEDNESSGFKSLFSDARFSSLDEVLQHDHNLTGFSLKSYRAQHGLDQVCTIRLINYIRTAVGAGQDPVPGLAGSQQAWQTDDSYLQPVLADDELMFYDWEQEEEGEQEDGQQAGVSAAAGQVQPSAATSQQRLQEENEALRGMVESLKAVVLQGEGVSELVADQSADAEGGASAGGASDSTAAAEQSQDCAAAAIDASYFDSYSTFDIHREMLADKVRTEAYRDALEKNPGLVSGARVLDLGCGTAILSMFAARAGAASVVGIDGSEQIAGIARSIVEANGLAAHSGGPITIVSSKVEQLAALPAAAPVDSKLGRGQVGGEDGQQVDVLVSEWMGYALLFESMLSSVLHARDRWLRPGGALLPDIAKIYVAAADEGASGLAFWKDVYGFSMEAVRSSLKADALQRAVVRCVAPQHLLSEPACVHSLDLATMRAAEQDFTSPFTLTPGAGPKEVHAVVLWFDTLFSERFCAQHPVCLSTGPSGTPTHWMQTVLVLKQPLTWAPAAVAGDTPGVAVAITGQVSMARSKQTHRSLDIVLRYAPRFADGSSGEEQVTLYGLGVHS